MKKIAIALFIIASISSANAGDLVYIGTSQGDKSEATIKSYGIPMSKSQFTAKEHAEGYQNVIIKNKSGKTVQLDRVLTVIDMSHFRTSDGKWTGNRVTEVVVE